MREMVIKVQLTKNDTEKDIVNLALEIMSEINDRGYGVLSVNAEEQEIIGIRGINKPFFGIKEHSAW